MELEITENSTIEELVNDPSLGVFSNYLFTYMTPDRYHQKLSALGYTKCGLPQAIGRIRELAASDGKGGRSYVLSVYPKTERQEQWDKESVKLLHFPFIMTNMHPTVAGEISAAGLRPYAIIIPGGGFNRQWGLIEGMSIASYLNARGISAFVLFHRVKQEPLMPKPLEDLNRAIAYIELNADRLEVSPGHYSVIGFSAGATVASELGSTNFGWCSSPFDLDLGLSGTFHWEPMTIPKPESLILAYGAYTPLSYYGEYCNAKSSLERAGTAHFLRKIAGNDFSMETLEYFELVHHIDASYPATYLVANRDDDTVSIENTLMLSQKLEELCVPHAIQIGERGGHSFGLGNGLAVEGWLNDAMAFWAEESR